MVVHRFELSHPFEVFALVNVAKCSCSHFLAFRSVFLDALGRLVQGFQTVRVCGVANAGTTRVIIDSDREYSFVERSEGFTCVSLLCTLFPSLDERAALAAVSFTVWCDIVTTVDLT